ncbi:hypothetical protein GCM10027418_06210 [Mariniluteicoccus endophyticus]
MDSTKPTYLVARTDRDGRNAVDSAMGGLSVRALARTTDITPGMIQRVRTTGRIRIEWAIRIADALAVRPSRLFQRADGRPL